MANRRARRFAYTVQTDKVAGVDLAQIPCSGVPIRVYKQGATVSTTGPLSIATATAVSVYDSGRIEAGDTVALWRLNGSGVWARVTSGTATVATKTSRTSLALTVSGSLSVQRGDRLVPTTSRPTVYDEITGTHSMTGSPSPVCNSVGQLVGFVTEGFVDVVVGDGSTGTPAISEVLDPDVPVDQVQPNPWVDASLFASIQDAINSLPSGGTVFIPAGTYSVSASLSIPVSDITLLGDQHAKTVIQPSADNPSYHLITLAGGIAGVTIENIGFNGRATAEGNYDVLQIVNPGSSAQANVVVQNCSFYNAQRNAARLMGCFDVMFRDCGFFYCYAQGVYMDAVGSDNCTHPYFYNCEFDACDTGGKYTASGGTIDYSAVKIDHALGATFSSCRFESNRGGQKAVGANGLHAKNALGLKVIGCHFEPRHAAGTYQVNGQPQQLVCLEDSAGAVFLGCTFDGGGTGALKPFYAIMAYGSKRGLLLGGRIDNIDQKYMHCDTGSNGWVVMDPDYGVGNVATTYSDSMRDRAFRLYGGLKIPRFADDSARDAAVSSGGASADTGTLIWVSSPTSPTSKLQVYNGSAWEGIGDQAGSTIG